MQSIDGPHVGHMSHLTSLGLDTSLPVRADMHLGFNFDFALRIHSHLQTPSAGTQLFYPTITISPKPKIFQGATFKVA